MKANAGGRTPVKVERIHSFKDVSAEFVPRISLRENALRQAIGAVSTVPFLHDLTHEFAHTDPW
jgi:hypothetical protein